MLPHDEAAEQFCVGLAIHGRREWPVDPVWFLHDSRRQLWVAATLLGAHGYLFPVPRLGDPSEICMASLMNARRVSEAVEATGWEGPQGSAYWEAVQSLNSVTVPEYGGYFAERLRDCWERRTRLLQLESEMAALLQSA